ncbi:MAG: amino acid ABC transporter permease [Desulfobacterales bacterium]|jgi:polar amino acid transport system permease protein
MTRSGDPLPSFLWLPWKDILKLLLLVSGVVWLLARGSERLGYHWQWYRIPEYFFTIEDQSVVPGPLIQGLVVTLKVTGISLLLATLFGLLTAFFRLSTSFLARAVARAYLELIRNTPLLVQLFFIYFVLAPVIGIERFTAAVLALSLFEGAYASEIFRAGIVSIHKGQWEAAFSLGMSMGETYRHVVMPQALRRILPPLTSQAISLIKDSALVSTIAVYDLTMQGQSLIAETFLVFELWFTIAAIYLVLTVSISLMVNLMERRLKAGTG